MKKLVITFCVCFGFIASQAQSSSENQSLQFALTAIKELTTRVDLNKDPEYLILRNPGTTQWNETLTFETSDRFINIPLSEVTKATVLNYGIILTGAIGEATIYMNIENDPMLQNELQNVLDNYIVDSKIKQYTVYEDSKW